MLEHNERKIDPRSVTKMTQENIAEGRTKVPRNIHQDNKLDTKFINTN